MENKKNDQAKKLTKDEVKALREQVLRTRVKGGPAAVRSLEGGVGGEDIYETW